MKVESGWRRLWAFDFDGTLSLLVPDRDAARLHPACRYLLKFLSEDPRNIVAVISSRSLTDLISRVPVPGIFLAGGSGLEWRFPTGHRIIPGDAAERKLAESREAVLSELSRLSAFPGVELEDKKWSVAVHFRHVLPEALCMLDPLMRDLKKHPGIRVFEGPAAAEVQFFRSVSKSFGIRRLCRILEFDPSRGRVFYAGDDANDVMAIKWVMKRKGEAILVGDRVRVKGVRNVQGPQGLARAVLEMADAGDPGARARTAGRRKR
jgi:trehalose 6-phosphate phosphatase